MRLEDLVDFNPTTRINKGQVVPFIDMASLPTAGRYIPTISEKAFSGSGLKFKDGDTLFARITPCLENGKGGLVHGLGDGVVAYGSTEFIVFRAKRSSDEEFAYYLSRLPEFRIFAEKQMSGTSGRQRVSWQSLKDFEIFDFEPAERTGIASTLGAIDDKIEMNRRMNKTLEAMVRAIFKDWFIDFGPTRAKIKGREPYLAPEIWELFPDKLNEEGKPEGWETTNIGAVAEIKSGKRPPSKLSAPDREHQVPVYGGNGISWYTSAVLYEPPFLITGRVGTLGTVFRVYEKVWVSDNALCCFPRTEDLFELLYFHLLELDFQALNSGSTQPLLTQTALKTQSVVAGSAMLVGAFSQCVKPLFSRITQNEKENITLAQTRDVLLPKLMSGGVCVAGAVPQS